MIHKLMLFQKDQGVQRTPMNKDYDQIETDPVRKAFRDWKEAANEWVTYYRELEQQERPLTIDEQKRLRELERRLNKAAERYELALQKSN